MLGTGEKFWRDTWRENGVASPLLFAIEKLRRSWFARLVYVSFSFCEVLVVVCCIFLFFFLFFIEGWVLLVLARLRHPWCHGGPKEAW